MSRTNGYILLYKQIADPESWVWKDKPFSRGQAWIDMLLMANFKDVKVQLKGQLVSIKRGQLVRGLSSLADRWGWSVGKVQRFLKTLADENMCKVKGEPYGQVITILNYNDYQDDRYPNSMKKQKNEYANRYENGYSGGIGIFESNGSRRYLNGQADEQSDGQADEQRENKGVIKDKEGAFESPPAAAVFSFFKEHNYISDPEAFLAYYEDRKWTKKNGQPVRDWKSSAKSWERREKQFVKERTGTEPRSGKSNVPVQQEPPKYKEFEPEEKKDKVQMTDEQRKRMKAALA